MCSLADAIVGQNLSVLTRGNTLRPKVLLLGGPNTYLPFLQQCWRLRIPETWDERGYDYPKDVPIEELIFVPDNAELYAAYGAVMYGMHEPAEVGATRASTGSSSTSTTAARPSSARAPARGWSRHRRARGLPREVPHPEVRGAKLEPGQVVRAVIGLDGGSTSSKACSSARTARSSRRLHSSPRATPSRT
jgi:activator of 2-hydroxyglutaryl-CoA dehydratase